MYKYRLTRPSNRTRASAGLYWRRYWYWEFMRLDLKSYIIKLIDSNGIFGVMNNTKWNNLLVALSDIDELLDRKSVV